jgi:RNA 2',3'-cyclic 3'-phosphodiesterase
MMHMQSIRAFIGIDPDDETRERLAKIQRDSLKMDQFSSVKVVDPRTVHITLNFLGNITPFELAAIREALSSISFHPFCVTLDGISVFPSVKKMRIIHVGLNESEDLKALHGLIVKALEEKHASDRKFDPHITLGRVKRAIPAELKQLATIIAPLSTSYIGRFNVSSFQLKKSTLTPKGPIYDTLEEFLL